MGTDRSFCVVVYGNMAVCAVLAIFFATIGTYVADNLSMAFAITAFWVSTVAFTAEVRHL